MLKYQQIYRLATRFDTLLRHQNETTTIAAGLGRMLAVSYGSASPALKLAHEANLMEHWLDGKMDHDERMRIKPEVDRIRGGKFIDECRDNKRAQLEKVVNQLDSVEKKLDRAILN